MFSFAHTLSICAAAITSLALAATASATEGECEGAGGPIPPTGTGGTNPATNTFESSIEITTHGEIGGLTVMLDSFVHTWAGDLQVLLFHEDTGTTVDLMNRIGIIGGSGFGDSSNFNGTYEFGDSFGGDIWAAAAALNTSGIIPSGQYFPCSTDGNPSFLNAFHGEDSFGTWTLRITDFQSSDAGSLGCWGLTLVTRDVPAPGAVALLGLAGLCASRRRRRR